MSDSQYPSMYGGQTYRLAKHQYLHNVHYANVLEAMFPSTYTVQSYAKLNNSVNQILNLYMKSNY